MSDVAPFGETPTRLKTLFMRSFVPLSVLVMLLVGAATRGLYDSELELIRNRDVAQLEQSLISFQSNLTTPQNHLFSLQHEPPVLKDLDDPSSRLQDMEDSFASLLSRNSKYFQVRWIDQQGMERLRLEPGTTPYTYRRTPDAQLQNKAQRYYVQETLALPETYQLYLSPLDLNEEFGRVETPLRPTLRMAVRLHLKHRPMGMVIINIDAADYLHDLNNLPTDGAYATLNSSQQGAMQKSDNPAHNNLQLINNEGYWLHHPKSELEWGFQLPHGASFKQKYPAIWQLIHNYSQHQVMTDSGLWSWVTLYPSKDMERFNHQSLGFVLLHQSKEVINTLRLKYWGTGFLILLLILGISGLILFRVFKAQQGQLLAEQNARNEQLKMDQLRKQREDEQRFRVIFNASHTPLLVCDSGGNITLVNPALEKLFGYSAFELNGLPVEHLIPVAMRKGHIKERQNYLNHLRPRRKMMKNGESLQGIRKDGQLVDVEIGLSPYESEGEIFILATVDDITSRIKAEREMQELHQRRTRHLENARTEAERLARLKSDFLANMSHEIRTPMNAIMVLGELLAMEELPDNARTLSQNIRTAGSNLLQIVNDVLDFSKIEAGGLVLEQVPFRLQDVLGQLLAITSISAKQKGLELHLNTGGCERFNLIGDPHRLRQVLLNLISNGIKFTEQGQVSLHLQKAAISNQSISIRFSVEDTGIGIPETQRAAIFNAFAQADSSVTRQFGGTGLGLAISQQLTQLMGGELTLEDRYQGGSRFSFTLTFPLAEKGAVEAPAAPQLLSGRPLQGKTLLVVDDSELNCDIARRIIEKAGGRALLAEQGQTALDLLSRKDTPKPDLVLMDLQMPVMDGYEATRRLHQLPGLEKVPVIALTAGITQQAQTEALAAGAIRVLTKPFTIQQIITCLEEVFEKQNTLARFTDTAPADAATTDTSPDTTESAELTVPADTGQSEQLSEDPSDDGFTSATDADGNLYLDEATALFNWGDKPSLQQFLRQFAEQYRECDAEVEQLLEDNDPERAERFAHKVKGAAASLYLNALKAVLSDIEQDLKNKKTTEKLLTLSHTLMKTLDTISRYETQS